MITAADLDHRLDELSAAVDAWTRALFQVYRPRAEQFAGLLSYPLGWVDAELRPLSAPAPAGKRLRPALCLLICEAVGGDARPALAPAAAIELIHNFSLVHDDIQDQSPLRRGRPTVWALWETAQAINVGDGLFALAQLALFHEPSVPAPLLVEAGRRLSLTCLRLVEGQFLDLYLQAGGEASFETYEAMVDGKTGALIACAAWLGARFGGASPEQAERFAAFGRQLGLAFQFQDDLLGVWGDPTLTGKSAEADLRTRKQALPAVLGLQAKGPLAERFRALFRQPGEMSAAEAVEARQLLESIGVRQRVEELIDTAYARTEAALRSALGAAEAPLLWALVERLRQRSA